MSAITLLNRQVGPDGVSRYRTRIKVLVHSHNSDNVIDLSKSVYILNANKTLKSVGNLSVALTSERNWLNLIYPNDYINVYVDRSDGQGWVRLFFGFVDSIEESYRVSEGGVPLTVHSLACSDFQKALEKTEIYFNPHVAGRGDFSSGFVGSPAIAGAALRTRGVRVNGTPADLVTNLMLLLLGFGAQFLLPRSYNPRVMDRVRQQRADFILSRLSEDARRQVLNVEGYAAFLERIRSETGVSSSVEELTNPEGTTVTEIQRAERNRFSSTVINQLGAGSTVGTENPSVARERGQEAYNILNTTLSGYPPTLLDVIDIFTFVERGAIDGYISGAPVWERQGNLMSFLNFISNEVVNELFFDLRPVSRNGGLIAGTDFSRDLDDVEGNIGTSDSPNGIQYVPAMIMREYPFATVHSVDGSNLALTVNSSSSADSGSSRETLGLIFFGAIFSDQPNVPGRHVVPIPNINPEDLAFGRADTAALKHLDVAVIRDHEIQSTKFTRSDSDHFNLFEFYSDAVLGNDARFFMQDLLPIITPIHIVRHGLRVRSLTTRYARFSLAVSNRVAPTASPPPPAEEETPEPDPVPASTPVFPVDLVGNPTTGYSQGFVTAANLWWYRRKEYDGARPVNNVSSNPVPARGVQYWRFHNGVDVHGPYGVPVKAIADGRVVLAAPVGTNGRAGYGNIVVVYHPQYQFYSLYAHLSAFSDRLAITSRSRRIIDYAADEYISGGRFTPVEVRAGDVLGFMGNSDALRGPGPGDPSRQAHLHFEINVPRNGRIFPSGRDRTTLTPDYFVDSATAIPGFPVSHGRPPNPDESLTISQDPIRVFRETLGLEWPVQRVDGIPAPVTPGGTASPEEVYPGDEAENAVDTDHEIPPAPPPEEEEAEDTTADTISSVGAVDAPTTRRQIARWALLNDHWYQHNLEYISGTIELRGAPEIRVGYRLDLIDRNLSFYVEGVSHNWQYGKPMITTLQVTRGQPSNPYPSYVLPRIAGFEPTETQRQTGSRLAAYFLVPDPLAVRRATKLENKGGLVVSPTSARTTGVVNEVDSPDKGEWWTSTASEGVNALSARYGETIMPAESITIRADVEEALQAEIDTLASRTASGSSTSAVETNPQAGVDGVALAEAFDVFDDPRGGGS